MKNVCLTLFLVLFASASFAQTNTVARWQKIVGNITAVGVDNPVAGISTGGAPWTTTGGTATVNLSTGAASFQVQGAAVRWPPTSEAWKRNPWFQALGACFGLALLLACAWIVGWYARPTTSVGLSPASGPSNS